MMYAGSLRGGHIAFVKGQMVNVSVFAGRAVSLTRTQLSFYSGKAAIGNMQMSGHDCVPIRLCLQRQWGPWGIVCHPPQIISFNSHRNPIDRNYHYYYPHFTEEATEVQN